MKANITEAVSTSYHAQTVGKSIPDKPESLFTRDIKNISVFITTLPQTQPLHNTSFGPIGSIMDTPHDAKKGRFLNTLENFYIYRDPD